MAGLCRLKLAAPLLLHLRRITLSRSFGAAAAAQPQFNVDYHPESEYEPLRGSATAPMVDSEGSAPSRGVQWVFIGNPGANKHVYAGKLSKLLQVPHISIASLVRQDLHPRSSLYEQVSCVQLSFSPLFLISLFHFAFIILISVSIVFLFIICVFWLDTIPHFSLKMKSFFSFKF